MYAYVDTRSGTEASGSLYRFHGAYVHVKLAETRLRHVYHGRGVSARLAGDHPVRRKKNLVRSPRSLAGEGRWPGSCKPLVNYRKHNRSWRRNPNESPNESSTRTWHPFTANRDAVRATSREPRRFHRPATSRELLARRCNAYRKRGTTVTRSREEEFL